MSEIDDFEEAIQSIANKLGVSYEAVHLICFLPDYAANILRGEVGDVHDEQPERTHITAAQLCEAARDYAFDYYGDAGPTTLKNWGIRSSKDIGMIVFELVHIGYLETCDKDMPEDFDGLGLFS